MDIIKTNNHRYEEIIIHFLYSVDRKIMNVGCIIRFLSTLVLILELTKLYNLFLLYYEPHMVECHCYADHVTILIF